MTLLSAIEDRDIQAVRDHLARRAALAERTTMKETPLHIAAKVGWTEVVGLLIEAGVPVDSLHYRKQTPLHYAASMGHEAVVSMLLAAGADPNALDAFKKTPLHEIVKGGGAASADERARIAALLCEAGCRVDHQDSAGRSALWFASNRGDTATVQVLVANGASPDLPARGTQGTPRDAAAAERHQEVLDLLGA